MTVRIVRAVTQDVNKLRLCVIPLLALPQGRVAASSRKCCEATERRSRGGFPLCSQSENHPGLATADAPRHLLIARPPLLAVMQGGEYARFRFVHIFIDGPYSFIYSAFSAF